MSSLRIVGSTRPHPDDYETHAGYIAAFDAWRIWNKERVAKLMAELKRSIAEKKNK